MFYAPVEAAFSRALVHPIGIPHRGDPRVAGGDRWSYDSGPRPSSPPSA